ncbi:MAG: GntR family transcriptional regulator [Synergistetes bacterium]|nr:GntR family transcriptional regulator [Synergistota bacterium]MDW8192586.1 GntR family transcriptional regulator [Synergistota bacterium]
MIERRSLKDEVLEKVKSYIVSGRYLPGQKVVIDSLAKELGVSVTPVREALHYLAAQGLLVSEPHRGFLVKKWSRKEIEDLLSLRAYLERLAAKLFIERGYDAYIDLLREKLKEMELASGMSSVEEMTRLNSEFHAIIVKGAGNEELRRVIDSLSEKLYRVRVLSISYPGRFKDSYKEHMDIYEAIESKNISLAEKRVEEHINSILRVLLKRFEEGLI